MRVLQALGSREPQDAWTEFLRCYSSTILQVVRTFERDKDSISDCFLYVCEELSRNSFRRLRRFQPEGSASFTTWLRVVVRNLCLDWHRREFGRQRIFRSIARLPQLDREVFRCMYSERLCLNETLLSLSAKFPGLTESHVEDSAARIRNSLSPRQSWLLSLGETELELRRNCPCMNEEDPELQLADDQPSPEVLAVRSEERTALANAVEQLSPFERLLIRLRFEQELTLDQIARLTGLEGAQSADRQMREILRRLRSTIKTESKSSPGKNRPVSVYED